MNRSVASTGEWPSHPPRTTRARRVVWCDMALLRGRLAGGPWVQGSAGGLVAVAGDELAGAHLHPHRRQAVGDQLEVVDDEVADLPESRGDPAPAVRGQDESLHRPGAQVRGCGLGRPDVHAGEEP